MRQTLAALLILLSFVPELPARNNHGWENVKKLNSGTTVEILLGTGESLSGEIQGVSDTGISLATYDDSRGPQTGWLRGLDRASIRRIVRVRESNLPDSRRWMITGAVAGGAVGLTAGAVVDARQGGNYHWFEGAFGGALLGFFASCMVLAATGIARTVHGLHRREVIYEAGAPQPVELSPWRSNRSLS